MQWPNINGLNGRPSPQSLYRAIEMERVFPKKKTTAADHEEEHESKGNIAIKNIQYIVYLPLPFTWT